MNIAILILAAGSSTRMGTAKQLLPVGNTILLGITIENALQTEAKKVYCVLGANSAAIKIAIEKHEVELIYNPNFKTGLSSSIVAGTKHLKNQNFDAVLILLGDQPHITTDYLNGLISSYKKDTTLIIASNYTSNIGVPAIIPKSYFNNLLELNGDKGAKAFLNSNQLNVITVDGANLLDIDTKEDYEAFIKTKYINKID